MYMCVSSSNNSILKGAVHHYYESRRRIFNNSLPSRANQVAKNKLISKKKGYRRRPGKKFLVYHRPLPQF